MSSLNKVQLIGNLGADPETRYAPSGDAISNFNLATSERWKDKQTGEVKEKTEWHRIAMFGRTAEIAHQYLKKGALVYIEGRLQTRKWQDKDGQDRYTTEIRADQMKMLGGRYDPQGSPQDRRQPRQQGNDYAAAREGRQHPPSQDSGGFGDFSDDIPF